MRFIVLAVPLGRKAVPRLISETSTTRRSMHQGRRTFSCQRGSSGVTACTKQFDGCCVTDFI